MTDKEFLEAIGRKIVELRKSRGIGQQELAVRVGMTNMHLRRIERGEVNCGILFLKKIAEELKTSINDLIV